MIVERRHNLRTTVDVLKVFKENGMGLKFTFEATKTSSIQFLDIG